ncbi:hypothetical protein [Mycobacterium sp.]|uniref:hypothetical protein n=1 Tax=Mycobacterium sp. TaxID=1785 RepID=UPI003BAEE2CC
MADGFDVAARLAEGRPAVERTQTYVDACHQLGYQQPDLTAHASQVWEWYDTEAGLDLRVLDDDTGALRAAATAIEEALWVQRTQVTELAVAWRGRGADSAARFLQHHCDVATAVAARVRAAAEHYGALREDIWKAVDAKVATAVAIDERRAAQRSDWLTAAQFGTAGTRDRSTAEEVIRQQITPYVDNDIRNDWLAAMGSGAASVAASYDAAIHALASTSEVRFDIPGDWGPAWQPVLEQHPVAESTPVMALPANAVPTVAAAAPAPQPSINQEPEHFSAGGLDDTASMPPELATPLGDVGGLSSGAGSLGSATGGIGGVVGSIIDSIGSILGSLAGGLGNGTGVGDSPVDDPLELADDNKPDDDDVKPDDAVEDDKPEDAVEDDKPDDTDLTPDQPVDSLAETPSATSDPVGEPVGQELDPPPPAAPADQPGPAAASPDDGSTPCEIAEDQLPQAGQ